MTAVEAYVYEAVEEAENIRLVHEIEARIARGESTWPDWEDVEKELNALPD